MKKHILWIFVIFLFSQASFAGEADRLPTEFYLKQHSISYTTSYDLETKTKRLGTLYRRVLSFILTYDFYDNAGSKLATAEPKFFSFTTKFIVKDNNNQVLGMAEEDFHAFFPSFTIYEPDGAQKLAAAVMNFWGTQFTITDPASDKEIAIMFRPFFRFKNDWTIRITNPELFYSKSIDNRLFMTILAYQGDMEYLSNRQFDKNNIIPNAQSMTASRSALEALFDSAQAPLLAKIDSLATAFDLDLSAAADKNQLEETAKELENTYQADKHLAAYASTEEKINDFTDFCFNLVESSKTPSLKKQTILNLLKLRLNHGSI